MDARWTLMHAVAASLLVLSMVGPVHAQESDVLQDPHPRQGYYISVVPTGSLSFHTTSDGTLGPKPGPGVRFRLGEALTSWLDLGIAGGVAVNYGDKLQALNGNFSIDLTLHPMPFLFVEVAAGLGFTDFTRQEKGMERVVGRFSGEYTVAVGYEFFLWTRRTGSGGFSLAPVVGAQIGPAKPTGTYLVFVGLAVNFWTGLPRNQLNLSVEDAF